MDFDLTDEQRLIKETAREFTDKEIVLQSRENARNHHFDLELVKKVADQGYLGAIVPQEYGGAGLDYLSYGLVVEEIGRGDSAIRTVISVQTSLVCSGIVSWGTEEQKHKYLPKLCSGEWLGCFGLTEPDTGSDAANQKTRAQQDRLRLGDQRREDVDLDGQLREGGADLRPDRPGARPQGPRLLHRRHRPAGLQTRRRSSTRWACTPPTRRRSRWKTSRSQTTTCSATSATASKSRCRTSTPGATRWRRAASGICQGCVEESVKYAKEREQFGRPIASFQLVQAMIADMVVKTDASRMLVWRAGFLKDKGRPNTLETSIAKLHATEASLECANIAIQVHGGAGYVDDHPVERYFRDARVTTIYEGTSQIQKLIIGRGDDRHQRARPRPERGGRASGRWQTRHEGSTMRRPAPPAGTGSAAP